MAAANTIDILMERTITMSRLRFFKFVLTVIWSSAEEHAIDAVAGLAGRQRSSIFRRIQVHSSDGADPAQMIVDTLYARHVFRGNDRRLT